MRKYLYHDPDKIYENKLVLEYCEKHGIYEVYSREGNEITYFSLYPEGLYRVRKNVKTGRETRAIAKYGAKYMPAFIAGKYNYMCG